MSRLWVPEDEENKYTLPLIQRVTNLEIQLKKNTEILNIHIKKRDDLQEYLNSVHKRYKFLRGPSVPVVNFHMLQDLHKNKINAIMSVKREDLCIAKCNNIIDLTNKELDRLNKEIQKNRTKILRFSR